MPYTRDSTAEKLPYSPPPRKPSVQKKPRRSPRPKFIRDRDKTHKLPILTIITLVLVFICGTTVAISSAGIASLRKQEAILNAQLRDTRQVIANLREEVNRSQDAAEMRELAEKELGMSEPKPYQIIHIEVPRADYAESYD